jgi:sacsin
MKDGIKFVSECLNFPSDPSTISPQSVFSLLECIQLLMQENELAIKHDFRERLSKNWLKTHAGKNREFFLMFSSLLLFVFHHQFLVRNQFLFMKI